MKTPRLGLIAAALTSLCLLLAGCDIVMDIDVPAGAHWDSGKSTVNGDIHIGANAVVDGGMRTVNGDVHAEAGAHTGELVTVNGDIHLDHDAQAGELTTVNGSIQLLGKAVADGDVTSVNGDIATATGVHIKGSVTNVNGTITLCATQVGKDVQFVNGTLLIAEHSTVAGDVIVKKPEFNSTDSSSVPPVMVVGPHATVAGTITFERAGTLYVSDSAVIHAVQGVTPQKYSGTLPAGVKLAACPD